MSSQSFVSSAHIIVVVDISGWKWVCDLTLQDGVVFMLSIRVHKIFHGRIQTVKIML